MPTFQRPRLLLRLAILMTAIVLLIPAETNAAPASSELTVYANDSFASKGSLGRLLAESFEKKNGVKTKFVAFPSAGEALNQVALEGKNTRADIVVGVDDGLLARARQMDSFSKIDPPVPGVDEALNIDSRGQFVPYDYGYLAFVYDSRRTQVKPGISLRDFAKQPSLNKKVVIQDPRTSSIGLGFLIWTKSLYPQTNEWEGFWSDLSSKLLSVSPSWTGAYGMFLKKEADFVLSYTTSPAYHIEEEKTDAFRAVEFPEGHYRQTETAGIVKFSKQTALARKWIEHLLSQEIQTKLPAKQWMYPARKGIALPASFSSLAKVSKPIHADPAEVEISKREWVRSWTSFMARTP